MKMTFILHFNINQDDIWKWFLCERKRAHAHGVNDYKILY
jgi:hypothetical protein